MTRNAWKVSELCVRSIWAKIRLKFPKFPGEWNSFFHFGEPRFSSAPGNFSRTFKLEFLPNWIAPIILVDFVWCSKMGNRITRRGFHWLKAIDLTPWSNTFHLPLYFQQTAVVSSVVGRDFFARQPSNSLNSDKVQ